MSEGIVSLRFTSYARTVMHYAEPAVRGHFDFNPEYQRDSVWNDAQRVALIRSLLMGIPIGVIILNHRGFSDERIFAIIDGKQRIETLLRFRDDQFSVPASFFGSDHIADPNVNEEKDEVTYSELNIVGQRLFGMLPIPSVEAAVKGIAREAEIFRLINTGGIEQTEADLDRAAKVETGE